MRTIESRLTRLEQRQEAATTGMVTMYDGPSMTADEVDHYNRSRRPDQPFIITLRIDNANSEHIS
jgi:hypothetical protein